MTGDENQVENSKPRIELRICTSYIGSRRDEQKSVVSKSVTETNTIAGKGDFRRGDEGRRTMTSSDETTVLITIKGMKKGKGCIGEAYRGVVTAGNDRAPASVPEIMNVY